jgi:parvulin-like peptidyl-prolyl isomerase
VITVENVCPPRPKPTAATAGAAKTGAAKTATAAKATTSATAAADCKTVITKEEFEKLLKGVTAAPTPQIRRQVAGVLPRFIAMSTQAQKEGLDKTPEFQEMVKFAKMQILTQALQRKIQEEAADVPEADIESYYKTNPEAFEQFSVERLFVPRAKQVATDAKEEELKDEKPTEEQQKAKQAQEKAKQDEAEQAMTKEAEDLRARAAAGETFEALQKEAFAAAGMKIESPTVKLPAVRRTGLPAAHAAVFDLKPGDVSQVISDSAGHYIYKLESKTEIPLEQAKAEIRNTLQNQRMRDLTEKVNSSYKVDPNPDYFGPGPLTAPQPRLPNRLPAPQRPSGPGGIGAGAPSQTPQASQHPAQAPASKPN